MAESDGSAARALTTMKAYNPDWSPDGSEIAFAGGEVDQTHLYLIKADGTARRRLETNGLDPSWSPDDRHLAIQSDGDIAVLSLDGGQLSSATSNPDTDREYDELPDYSPDGNSIVFLRVRNEDPELSAVWVVGADGTDARPLTPYAMRAARPKWSPDGTRVVFNDGRGTVQPGSGKSHIFVINADGTGLHQLTKERYAADFHPSWSPDGRSIFFTRYTFAPESRPFAVFRIDTDGSHAARVYSTPDGDVNNATMAP